MAGASMDSAFFALWHTPDVRTKVSRFLNPNEFLSLHFIIREHNGFDAGSNRSPSSRSDQVHGDHPASKRVLGLESLSQEKTFCTHFNGSSFLKPVNAFHHDNI